MCRGVNRSRIHCGSLTRWQVWRINTEREYHYPDTPAQGELGGGRNCSDRIVFYSSSLWQLNTKNMTISQRLWCHWTLFQGCGSYFCSHSPVIAPSLLLSAKLWRSYMLSVTQYFALINFDMKCKFCAKSSFSLLLILLHQPFIRVQGWMSRVIILTSLGGDSLLLLFEQY